MINALARTGKYVWYRQELVALFGPCNSEGFVQVCGGFVYEGMSMYAMLMNA